MIVKSILDTDLYKFTTSYAYMKLFPQARGTFEFFDRDLTEYPEDFVQKVYLEQIGAKSYAEVDDILQTNANNIFDSTGRWVQPLMEKYGEDVVVKVLSRHVTSEFKRMKAPIYISRELYE
jgi:hypothetical protein